MKRVSMLSFVMLLALSGVAGADDDPYQAGREIFEQRCSDTCHQTPDPGQLNEKQWRVVLNTMQKRMRGMGFTPLTEEELQQLLQYLAGGQE